MLLNLLKNAAEAISEQGGQIGAGLSVSRHIMRLHGGTLVHFTKEGQTVFRMAFYHSGKQTEGETPYWYILPVYMDVGAHSLPGYYGR